VAKQGDGWLWVAKQGDGWLSREMGGYAMAAP
jgi:hypothetical protein